MAERRIYSCDRCGKEWKEENRNGFVNRPKHLDYEALRYMDLCEECYKEFYRLVREYEEAYKDVKTKESGAG